MTGAGNIGDIIREIANKGKKFELSKSLLCEVVSVDSTERTLEALPINEAPKLLGVRLQAPGVESPVLIYPKVGSLIIVSEAESGIFYVSMFSEAESIILRGEEFGGIVKAPTLREELEKLSSRLDKVIDAIKNGVPAAGSADGGTALKTSIVTALNLIIDRENFGSIENEKIKHG